LVKGQNEAGGISSLNRRSYLDVIPAEGLRLLNSEETVSTLGTERVNRCGRELLAGLLDSKSNRSTVNFSHADVQSVRLVSEESLVAERLVAGESSFHRCESDLAVLTEGRK